MHLDIPLFLTLIVLCLGGLFVLYSASGQSLYFVKRQAVFMLFGFVAMIAVAQFPVRFWERWALLFYIVGLLSLVAVMFFGVGAKGAQRWLDLGVTRFQPSELMKVAVPMTISAFLGKRYIPPSFQHISISLILILLPVLLIIKQPDLGTAILVFISGFFVLFLAGLRKRYLVSAFLLVMAAIPSFWIFVMRDYQKQRVLTLLSPEDDKLGAGWNIIQSKTAIGSGGWGGKGWLSGTQSHLDFLPESQTDFIIAVLAEEFGLQGVLLLLGLYLLVIMRGFWIGLHAQSGFARLLASAITFTFFVYVFVNMGMVAGILPVVGVPLPLVSFGGTSMVTLMLAFGVLMAISTEQRSLSA